MPMNTQKHDTSDCKNQHHLLCSPDEPKLARRFLPPLEGLGISSKPHTFLSQTTVSKH